MNDNIKIFNVEGDNKMAEGRSSVIISVFSTTPGIGKTLTAINLASGMASEGYQVCLVDLDLQFGDIMNYLKLNSDKTIAGAQRAFKNNPDSFDIRNYLIEYRTGFYNFSVLAAPLYVRDAYQIDVMTVENIVGQQLSYYDFVILDLNSVFSSLNLAMLDLSTIINYLGVIDFLPALKNFKIGYDTLIRFEYEEQKIRLVENRADSQKLIKSSDVERLLGESFYHRLPNDYLAASKSINEGRPLIFSAPDSNLTRSFMELTALYTNRKDGGEIYKLMPETANRGFFSRALNVLFG